MLPGFDADAVDASDATLVSLVATALQRVDTTRWRAIVLGGSRPPADRPANAVTTYGLTETGSGVVYDRRPLDGGRDPDRRRRGAPPRPHAASLLPRRHRPEARRRLVPTGDLGEVDEDGALTVHGRAGDLIITGGENVWPEPVEAALADAPGVADVAIVGRPDDEWGQRVHAVVVPTHPARPPDLETLPRGGEGGAAGVLRSEVDRVPRLPAPHQPRQAPAAPTRLTIRLGR